jgi:hypothetical protein
MTKTEFKIENVLEYDVIYSNLVYPLDKGYYYDALLDRDWVDDLLYRWFGVRCRIANKYAIELVGNSNNPIIIVNHDGKHYLINKQSN